MPTSRRSPLTLAVAVVAATAVLAAPSMTVPSVAVPSVTASSVTVPSVTARPFSGAVTSHTMELSAVFTELRPLLPQENSDGIVNLADQMQRGAVPSLTAAFPAPPIPGPSPVASDFAGTIKNTYSAIEPWVRYGFELATYAVGWVPYVGWLSGQIMIFYNFGERIVRSLVFNSADWLWGPLPLGEGLRNVAQDSWNAVVQLGIDEWNFFLPPLPPLPVTEEQAPAMAPAQVRGSLREPVDSPREAVGELAVVASAAITDDEPALETSGPAAEPVSSVPENAARFDDGEPAPELSSPAAVPVDTVPEDKAENHSRPVDLGHISGGVTSTPDLIRTEAAASGASRNSADAKSPRYSAQPGTVSAKRANPRLQSENESTTHDADTGERGSQSGKTSHDERRSGVA